MQQQIIYDTKNSLVSNENVCKSDYSLYPKEIPNLVLQLWTFSTTQNL